MKNKHIYFFVGTTAEYIKIAPIIKELKRRKIKYKLITSGQNRINFKDLEPFTGTIKVDMALKKKPKKSSILHFFNWAVSTFFSGFFSLRNEFNKLEKQNVYLIIHGDTISSLIGSFLAKLLGVKLVHIESGLRSFNFMEPIPEELNRFIITHMADVLFSPNSWAIKNLKKTSGKKVNTYENTLIESCLWAIEANEDSKYIEKFGKYYIFFIHRQEHMFINKEWSRKTMEYIIRSAPRNLNCVFVMHALTSRILQFERLNEIIEARKKLFIVPKLPYKTFMALMNNAEFIATDGCTNQEEAYYMGVPLLALRNLTERKEGLGENVAISKGNKKTIKEFLDNYNKYRRKKVEIKKRPSKIILDYLETTT